MRTILELGRRRIDLDTGEVEGLGVLRPMERALLRFLTENQERAVSVFEMHTTVWGYSPTVSSRAAYATIARLRPMVEEDPKKPEFLVAERGDGYRLRGARLLTIDEDGPPTNAARRVDRFFGREAECGQLRHGCARVITVVGPAGVGKSRLVAEAAAGAALPGGAWFCDLRGAVTADDLVRQVARSLPGTPPADPGAIGATLAARGRCWLVLDGAERLLQAVAALSTPLVDRAPRATIVVTSRQRLGTPEEQVLELLPLARAPAVALLRDRLDKRSDRWVMDAEIADRLCAEVDCLPLAVEIVAANVALLGPDLILDRLRRGGSFGPSLDAVVASMLEPVDPASIQLLATLAVLAGPVRMDAAEAALGLDDGVEAFARLADLLGADRDRVAVRSAVRAARHRPIVRPSDLAGRRRSRPRAPDVVSGRPDRGRRLRTRPAGGGRAPARRVARRTPSCDPPPPRRGGPCGPRDRRPDARLGAGGPGARCGHRSRRAERGERGRMAGGLSVDSGFSGTRRPGAGPPRSAPEGHPDRPARPAAPVRPRSPGRARPVRRAGYRAPRPLGASRRRSEARERPRTGRERQVPAGAPLRLDLSRPMARRGVVLQSVRRPDP